MKRYVTSSEVAKNKGTLYVTDDYDWAVAVNSKELMVYAYGEDRIDIPVPITAWGKDEVFWIPAEKGDLPERMHIDSSGFHSAIRFVFEEYDTE